MRLARPWVVLAGSDGDENGVAALNLLIRAGFPADFSALHAS